MLIRKAELQDVRAVYALICELEEQDLPLLEFENIFGSFLKLPEHFLMKLRAEPLHFYICA